MLDDMDAKGAFGDPDRRIKVDPTTDPDFSQECPFNKMDISTHTADI